MSSFLTASSNKLEENFYSCVCARASLCTKRIEIEICTNKIRERVRVEERYNSYTYRHAKISK